MPRKNVSSPKNKRLTAFTVLPSWKCARWHSSQMTATRPQRKIGDRSKSSPSSENAVHLADFWRFSYPNSHFTLSYPCYFVWRWRVFMLCLTYPSFQKRDVTGEWRLWTFDPKPAAPVQQRCFFHARGPWFWRIVLDPNQRRHPKGNDAPSIRNLRWNFLDLQFLCAMSTLPTVSALCLPVFLHAPKLRKASNPTFALWSPQPELIFQRIHISFWIGRLRQPPQLK